MGSLSATAFDPSQHPAGTVVTVASKPWYKSLTVVINGLVLVVMTFAQLMDVLTGNNMLSPIVGVFVKDPAQATHLIETLMQVYTVLNLYLRIYKTKAPVSLRSND